MLFPCSCLYPLDAHQVLQYIYIYLLFTNDTNALNVYRPVSCLACGTTPAAWGWELSVWRKTYILSVFFLLSFFIAVFYFLSRLGLCHLPKHNILCGIQVHCENSAIESEACDKQHDPINWLLLNIACLNRPLDCTSYQCCFHSVHCFEVEYAYLDMLYGCAVLCIPQTFDVCFHIAFNRLNAYLSYGTT